MDGLDGDAGVPPVRRRDFWVPCPTDAQKIKADKIIAANAKETDPDLVREVPHFPAKTWRTLKEAGQLPPSRANVPFSPRDDSHGRPVPNAVLKVPTGGGKTYLAVSALSRIFGRYLGRSTGFVP